VAAAGGMGAAGTSAALPSLLPTPLLRTLLRRPPRSLRRRRAAATANMREEPAYLSPFRRCYCGVPGACSDGSWRRRFCNTSCCALAGGRGLSCCSYITSVLLGCSTIASAHYQGRHGAEPAAVCWRNCISLVPFYYRRRGGNGAMQRASAVPPWKGAGRQCASAAARGTDRGRQAWRRYAARPPSRHNRHHLYSLPSFRCLFDHVALRNWLHIDLPTLCRAAPGRALRRLARCAPTRCAAAVTWRRRRTERRDCWRHAARCAYSLPLRRRRRGRAAAAACGFSVCPSGAASSALPMDVRALASLRHLLRAPFSLLGGTLVLRHLCAFSTAGCITANVAFAGIPALPPAGMPAPGGDRMGGAGGDGNGCWALLCLSPARGPLALATSVGRTGRRAYERRRERRRYQRGLLTAWLFRCWPLLRRVANFSGGMAGDGGGAAPYSVVAATSLSSSLGGV